MELSRKLPLHIPIAQYPSLVVYGRARWFPSAYDTLVLGCHRLVLLRQPAARSLLVGELGDAERSHAPAARRLTQPQLPCICDVEMAAPPTLSSQRNWFRILGGTQAARISDLLMC
eukprot:COSAG01_NODE_43677_length_427_cov_1.021341_1_plen_116_part_00